jgi:nucleotide-binding universal stress UspA family protein
MDLEAIHQQEEQAGRALLESSSAVLSSAGLKVHTKMTRGDAATEILEFTRSQHINLIICGSRGLNPVSGWLLGSVSRKLVHYAPCSVLIIK